MKPKNQPAPEAEFHQKDVDPLIASYSRPIAPEKKAALLEKLSKERPAYEQNLKSHVDAPAPARTKERGR